MILVYLASVPFALCCVYLPLARIAEMFGSWRGVWLALPLGVRLRTAGIGKLIQNRGG